MIDAHCKAHGTSYPWTQDCPECVRDARARGVSLDRYQRDVRRHLPPHQGASGLELPPLPEGETTTYSADEVRAYARSVALIEREHCAKLCEQKVRREAGYNGQWEGYVPSETWRDGPECAKAIRGR